MVDITILGQIDLTSPRKMIHKYIYRHYVVIQYEDQIIISKLEGSELVYYDALRYFENNTVIITPVSDSVDMYMIVYDKKIQRYTFDTQSMQIIYATQLSKYFQISGDRIIGLFNDPFQSILIDIKNNMELSAKNICQTGKFSDDVQIFDFSSEYFGVYSDSYLIIVQTSDFQIKNGFPFMSGLKNCFHFNLQYPIVLLFSNHVIISNSIMDKTKVQFGFNDYKDSWMYHDTLFVQRQNDEIFEFDLKNLQFEKSRYTKKLHELGPLTSITDDFFLDEKVKITRIKTGFDNVQVLAHVKVIRSQPFTRKNGIVGDQYVYMPMVVFYDAGHQEFTFLCLNSFNKISFITPPISQFCVTCTKKINYIGFSTYDRNTQESTIKIFCMNPQFTEAMELSHFCCYDEVQSLTISFDQKTVITAVTRQNTIYVYRCEEQSIAYCFNASLEIVVGFELPDEQNLYLIDNAGQGHFVTVPEPGASAKFSHILDTTENIYEQFSFILSMYSTRFSLDMTDNRPIVLPPNKDVEAIAFDANNKELFYGVDENKANEVLHHLDKLTSFYRCYNHCFQIKLKSLIHRLDSYRLMMKQVFAAPPLSRQSISTDYASNLTKIISEEEVYDFENTTVPKSQGDDSLKFRDIQKHFRNYNVERLLTHSLYQTISYSRFPGSQVFSYNMLSIFFQKQTIVLNTIAQFTVETLCRKGLPLIYSVCTDISSESYFQGYVKMIQELFAGSTFNYQQLSISLHTMQLCHSEKQSYKFTLAMITMFSIFATLVQFHEFKGTQIIPQHFQLIEDTLTAYFREYKNRLCLHNLYDFISQTNMISRYSCITLIRLYQQLSCNDRHDQDITNYLMDTCKELSAIQTSGSTLIPSIAKMPHFILVVEALSQPIYQELLRLSRMKKIKTSGFENIGPSTLQTSRKSQQAVFSSEPNFSEPTEDMTRVDSQAFDLEKIEVQVRHELKEAIDMLNGAVQQLLCLITSLQESEIEEMLHNNDANNVLSFSSLAIHSLCYNMFYINSIENYKIQSELERNSVEMQRKPESILDSFEEFHGSELQNELNEAFIKYSFVFPNDTQRFFCFEQLTQYCFKVSKQSFVQLIGNVVKTAQQEIYYKSLMEYITFLKYNYPCLLQEFGSVFIDVMLPTTRELFSGYLHTKSSKPLLLSLLKIVGIVSKLSEEVQHIICDKTNTSVLFYQSKAGFLDTFDFKNYTQDKVFFPDSSIRATFIESDSMDKDKRILLIFCLQNNCVIVNFDVLTSQDYLFVPIVTDQTTSVQAKASYDQLSIKMTNSFVIPKEGTVYIGYALDSTDIKLFITSNKQLLSQEYGTIHFYQGKKMSVDITKSIGPHRWKGAQIQPQKYFGVKRKVSQIISKDTIEIKISRK